MISILVPVFNSDVRELIKTLSNQIVICQVEAEIIVMDDGSVPSYCHLNGELIKIPGVQYIESGKNNGRMRIRQLLAQKASFDWLLFLDGDSKIISDRFLSVYLDLLAFADVIVGGRIYTSNQPGDCMLRLHWKYGTKRETIKAIQPNHRPDKFMTNNFLIRKDIFTQLKCTNQWRGYGHEDTLIGIYLSEINAIVKYADNPVVHNGLETASAFLLKTQSALQNLLLLSHHFSDEILKKHVKLYHFYCRLRTSRLLWIFITTFPLYSKVVMKNLHSCHPSLFLFDLYRLHYFAGLKKTNYVL